MNTGAKALVTAALLAIAAGRVARSLVIVTVSGESMEPAFHEGDRALVYRYRQRDRHRHPGRGRRPRRGAVVVVESPAGCSHWPGAALPPDAPASRVAERHWMIKRLAARSGDPVPPGVDAAGSRVPPGRLVLLGDNPDASFDSRQAGLIPAERLLGAVIRRLPG